MTKIRDGEFIGGEDLHSFLMIGQSNMAGRGEISDVEPIDNFRCYTPFPLPFRFRLRKLFPLR